MDGSFNNDEIAVAINFGDSLVVDQTIPEYLAQESEPAEDTVVDLNKAGTESSSLKGSSMPTSFRLHHLIEGFSGFL